MIEAADYGWQSLRLAAGEAELVLVPQVGGRLMGIRLGGEELLFVNPALAGRTLSDAELADPASLGFPLWGGEKTWVAPQSSWPDQSPMPDLDSAAYAVSTGNDGSITMTSPICRQTGLQVERTIAVDGNGWTTRHAIRNRSSATRFAGPWSVMMVNRDTVFHIPSPVADVVRMYKEPDRLISALGDLTVVDCRDTTVFKTGHPLREPWFAAFLPLPSGRVAMIAQFCDISPAPGRWAHGHVAEVYNAEHYPYCEMETHGGATDLAPGDETAWTLRTVVRAVPAVPATEAETRALVLA